MKHIWIINKKNSTTLFYYSISQLKLDPDLVSGLLTALNSFSEVELQSHGISSINMGGYTWVYSNQPMNLMLIAAGKKNLDTTVMRSRLEVISKMFIEKYQLSQEMMDKTLIDQGPFMSFSEEIKMLQMQWDQAEMIVSGGTAKMFDLLAVFQQLYNALNNIISYYFFKDEYDRTISEIKIILKNLGESPEFKDNPELRKIDFDTHGWSVINLNPMNLTEITLRRVLIMLTLHIDNIIKSKLSRSSKLNAYSRDIFPFLIDKYEFLDNLEVLQILLRIFLL